MRWKTPLPNKQSRFHFPYIEGSMSFFDTNSSSFKKLDTKTQTRLLALLALSERGVDGEKQNAISRLSKLLKKHNLTIKRMHKSTTIVYVNLSFTNEYEKTLANQIAWSLHIPLGISAPQNTVVYSCSPIQAAELRCRYDIYKKELARELDLTLNAFVHAQLIFPDDLVTELLTDYDGKLNSEDSGDPSSNRMVARALTIDSIDIPTK